MTHYSDHISTFLEFIRQSQRDCQWAADAERQANAESQDLLHRLELWEDGYHQTARLGRLLREVRRERRAAKDTYELTELIDHWAQENKTAVKSLERLLGSVRQIEERHKNRAYFPRTDVLNNKEA